MIIDRLKKTVDEKYPICVGLDTALEYIPESLKGDSISESVFNFNKEVIDGTKDLVAIYKPQIAYYEALGLEGMKAYKKTLEYLRDQDLLIIGDIKRGDISATAKMYAEAHFTGEFEVDFITLNPYMGFDSIEPYLPYIESGEKGVFVLMRTSNPGAKDLEDRLSVSDGKTLYQAVGEGLVKLGKDSVGETGYSSVAAVVGGTSIEEVGKIREEFPSLFFLVPGYGAQGGGSAEVLPAFNPDGNGAIVNSSRGIIKNHMKYDSEDVKKYSRLAVEEMIEDLFKE